MALREIDLNVRIEDTTDLNDPLYGDFHDDNDQEDFISDDVRERIIADIFGEESDEYDSEGNENFNSSTTHSHQSRERLSDEKRKAIYDMLQQKSVNRKLKRNTTTVVASFFSVPIRTVQRIWKQGRESETHDVSSKMRNCGRKRASIDLDKILDVPLHKRTTLRSLSAAMDVNIATLHRHLKAGDIQCRSNTIKPFLTEENKRGRLRFCRSNLDPRSMPNDPMFKGMFNVIHIDEKWYTLTKRKQNYYMLPSEQDPLRTCKSTNFIGKVMFLVAVACPRFDAQKNEIFSGKIGAFPIVNYVPAQRNSVNRRAGTMETKSITSITRDIMKKYMIEKVLPAIREKWPRDEVHMPIFIQQDNARTHISPDDEDFRRAATQDGFDIRLICQPPNSPDLNVLDLGFFAAIQSLQYKLPSKNVDDLINAVLTSFEAFSTEKSDHIFLTLQLCMREIMKAKGSFQYKIKHINKEMLERRGELPTQVRSEPELVEEVTRYLESGVLT